MVECVNVIGRRKIAHCGDEIVCVVQKTRQDDPNIIVKTSKNQGSAAAKLKQGDVLRAVVVRTRSELLRRDGSTIRFDDNAAVIIDKQGQPIGNRILGIVANECRQKRWAKIVALAPKLV